MAGEWLVLLLGWTAEVAETAETAAEDELDLLLLEVVVVVLLLECLAAGMSVVVFGPETSE